MPKAPMVSEREIRLPMPHAGQMRVRREMKRFNVLSAGRRWRKTTMLMSLAVERMLEGQEIVWGAPTYKQCDIAWDEFKKAVSGIFTFNRQRMDIIAPTGGKCHLRSLDNPDNARGLSADGIILDEAADIVEEAWTEVLRHMLIDREGWAFFSGTPKGRNWFYGQWMAAQSRPDAMAWQIPTCGCRFIGEQLMRAPHPYENPEVPFSEMLNMLSGEKAIPERAFRQEILAEFIEDAGGVFQNVDRCIEGQLPANPQPMHRQRRYVMGVDLAKHHDFTVCIVIDEESKRVVDFHRFNKIDWNIQKQRIYLIAQHWNDALTYIDATGLGDPIFDDLRRAGMCVEPFKIMPTSKRELIDNLIILIEQQAIHFPKIVTLVDELKAYEYERLPAGGLRMNAPSGQHDDCVIALALACWPLGHQRAPMSMNWLDELTRPQGERLIGGQRILSKKF